MSTEPVLTLRGHNNQVWCIAFSPDGRQIASGSTDNTVIIWDVVTGKAIGRPLLHEGAVCGVTFSPDNKRIVSAVGNNMLHIWNVSTGNILGSLVGHTDYVRCVAFSPDGQRIVSCSDDKTVRIWDGTTGVAIGTPLQGHTHWVSCVAFSTDGKRIMSGSKDNTIRIWDSVTGKEIGPPLEGHSGFVLGVAVSADGRRIVSGSADRTLRMWDAETGKAIGSPLQGHTDFVWSVAFSPDGTVIVSGSGDKTIRMWNGITGEAIGSPIQAHDHFINSVAFSPDGNWIASGSYDYTVKLWDSAWVETLRVAKQTAQFTIKLGDDPSILTNVSDAVAQCKQGELDAAMQKFDLAIALSSSSPANVRSVCSVLAIKAIALFEAGREEMAIARVDDLIRVGSGPMLLKAGFQMVKAYMLNQLAQKSFECCLYDRAVELLSEAISGDLLRTVDTYYKYRVEIPTNQGLALVKSLFGWDFEALRYTTNQNLCKGLRPIERSEDALDTVENMGKKPKANEQERYKQWSGFKQERATEWSVRGDQALKDGNYDAAIEQYSGSIALDPSNYTLYTNRSLAFASKQLWSEALDDAEQAIKLDPSLAIGYERRYRALCGSERYDEAIVALKLFTDKSGTSSNDQYASPDDIAAKIGDLASDAIKNMPTRLFDTSSGIMWNKGDILRKFKASDPYKKFLSSITTRDELVRGDSVTDLVNSYFRYAMLSHRWEDGEILLQDIKEGVSVHDMKSNSPGLVKLQKICIIASKLGILWAWSDTCCIDKRDAVELQRSIASMCVWYSYSAVTIVYLSDVDEYSSAAFINSKWFTRGWTLQELLAPPVITFYKQDWSLFRDEEVDDKDSDAMPHDHVALINHKERDEILYMIEHATEIDVETLRDFQPGMRDTRQKLRWASQRQTTEVEDAAYSLFGMFDIQLPVMYGEKEKALGRLLQEIVGQTGDLGVLDWVGQRGKAHSCLPLDISSFRLTQWLPPLLDDTEIAALVSSLRNSVLPQEIINLARVRKRLQKLPVPRFQQNRLSLPCISYPVKAVAQHLQTGRDRKIRRYAIKATGLKCFDIQTMEKLYEGSEARPSQQKYFVARIMRDDLLEQLMGDPEDEATGVFEMIVALSRPFLPFLLLRLGKTYQRIAVLDDVSTEVEDMMAVRAEGLDATTLEVV